MKNTATTTYESCNILTDLVVAHSVKHVILSPGSRNAPLIIAISRCDDLEKHIVVDERSAAFMALGIAKESRTPVMLVCTSGSAMLNYAPAVAEAFYSEIPLIIVSADRDNAWIDQDDGQAIHQYAALQQIVKNSYDIDGECNSSDDNWYVNRIINEACILSNEYPKGPVHINIHFGDNLYSLKPRNCEISRVIDRIYPEQKISSSIISKLVDEYNSAERVMIVGGFCDHNPLLQQALTRLSLDNRTVVMCETITNISGGKILRTIDRTISCLSEEDFDQLRPDLLITFGGATISRMIKKKLRNNAPRHHWHIGVKNQLIDALKALTIAIDVPPEIFFSSISDHITPSKSAYSAIWTEFHNRSMQRHYDFLSNLEWCDLKAFDILSRALPLDCKLHFSNGTPIRYAQLFGDIFLQEAYCNRGVSGIDGCTSTAVGASIVSHRNSILITGDTSFSYDLGGVSNGPKAENLKIIVIKNGGGGIFRFIPGPDTLKEIDEYFEVSNDVNVLDISKAFGYEYLEAKNEFELKNLLPQFINSDKRTILAIVTPSEINGELLRNYFRNINKQL